MIVLHAGFYEKRFLLWGETPAKPETHPPKLHKQKRPQPLPYDAGVRGLAAAIEAGLGFTADVAPSEAVIAWLPTIDNQPVASSPLIAHLPVAFATQTGIPESPAKTILAPWRVSALTLSPEQAVEVLCACVGKQTLAPGLIVGKDLRFWAMAMRFAGALVARQQFLPGVEEIRNPHPGPLPKGEGKRNYRACWKPVFAGRDADLLANLAKAMPQVCRALTREAVSPPQLASVSVVSAFISEMVDRLVRSAIVSVGAGLKPAPTPTHKRQKRAPTFDSIHDQWLYALRSHDGVVQGDAAELAQFAAQVYDWQRPIFISTATPFRLCFRLEEPDGNGEGRDGRGSWNVRYLLQAADDPSLLIPAKGAWNAEGQKLSILKRGGFNAQEYLLSSLGQASGICPLIEASLRKTAPEGYGLDSTGAYEFLTQKASVLEQAGFGVLLPAWWTGKGTKLRLSARADVKSPKMQGGSVLSLESIVEFNWQMALGDERLSFEELKALAELKQPLVKVRGQWVQMSAEDIQAALALWKKKAADQATVREIVRMALGAGKMLDGIAFDGVAATGWIADFLAQLEDHTGFEEFPAPDGFRGTLRPYQVRGYSWLAFLRRWGLGACLADDMGLGKTIQALALVQRDWESNLSACLPAKAGNGQAGGKRPVLLVCPMSVVGNWQKEASRFTPDLPVMVHHGIARTKGIAFKEEAIKQAMVISSYALLYRDFETLKDIAWSGVILDEAQNIKNPETKQARAARALRAEYRIALTGTPVENNIGDLWSIVEFLSPGFLGTQTDFKRTFFVPIQANRNPEAVRRLKRLTGPFILRRLKTDRAIISDLPEKMEMKVFCTLTKEQASLYAAVVNEATPELDSAEGIQRRGVILATLSKLKQVCNHPAQFLGDNSAVPGRSGKLSRLTEMLEEVIEVGDRALVFSQFAEMGEILRRHLEETFGREVLFLRGAVPKPARDRMVERFQADGDGPQIFILSLKAGGTGLNLTRANHVFHFDRWWNPAVENQATDRVFRIGQTRNVQVHKFLCVGTLEEKIDEMIERKKEIAEGVVGTGEGWLTELSTAKLKEIFALKEEAVGE